VLVNDLNLAANDAARLCIDGKEILSWSPRAGGFGSGDIWVSTRHDVHEGPVGQSSAGSESIHVSVERRLASKIEVPVSSLSGASKRESISERKRESEFTFGVGRAREQEGQGGKMDDFGVVLPYRAL